MKNPLAPNDDLNTAQQSRFIVRRMIASDIGNIMPKIDSLIDGLYPSGASKLFSSMEQARFHAGRAYVVAPRAHPLSPVALSSEKPKGSNIVKVGTFWVDEKWRLRGVGSALLSSSTSRWLRDEIETVHITVRDSRAAMLRPLFEKHGFREISVEIDRYGVDRSEVILQWRPEWMNLGTT